MKERIFLFIARFRDNNNVRANTFLVFLGLWLVAHAFILGFPSSAGLPLSEEAQRTYNAYFRGTYQTNSELAPWYSKVFGSIGMLWDSLRHASWFFWKWLIWAALGYRAWAWRDEIKRAWRSTMRLFREKRGGSTSSGGGNVLGTSTAAAAAAGTTQTTGGAGVSFVGEVWTFAREFLGAVVANIATHRR